MKKKSGCELTYSYNPDKKKPSFVKTPVNHYKEAQL